MNFLQLKTIASYLNKQKIERKMKMSLFFLDCRMNSIKKICLQILGN